MTDHAQITAEQIRMVIDSVLGQLGAIPLPVIEASHAKTKESLDNFMNIGHMLDSRKLHDGTYDDAEYQYKIADALIAAIKTLWNRHETVISDMDEKTVQFTLRNVVRVLGMIPVAALEQYIADASALHERIETSTLAGMMPNRISEADRAALNVYYGERSPRGEAVKALLKALKLAHEREEHAAGVRELRRRMGW